jgi:hypothetical protein
MSSINSYMNYAFYALTVICVVGVTVAVLVSQSPILTNPHGHRRALPRPTTSLDWRETARRRLWRGQRWTW